MINSKVYWRKSWTRTHPKYLNLAWHSRSFFSWLGKRATDSARMNLSEQVKFRFFSDPGCLNSAFVQQASVVLICLCVYLTKIPLQSQTADHSCFRKVNMLNVSCFIARWFVFFQRIHSWGQMVWNDVCATLIQQLWRHMITCCVWTFLLLLVTFDMWTFLLHLFVCALIIKCMRWWKAQQAHVFDAN